MLVEYKAIDFLGGMLAKATAAASVKKVLRENQGWNPVLFCDGPHMLGPERVDDTTTEVCQGIPSEFFGDVFALMRPEGAPEAE